MEEKLIVYPKLWITYFAIFVLVNSVNHLLNFTQTHFTHKMLQHKSKEDLDNLVSTKLCKQSEKFSPDFSCWNTAIIIFTENSECFFVSTLQINILPDIKYWWNFCEAGNKTMNEKRDIWLKRYFYLVSFLHHRTKLLKYRKIPLIGFIDRFLQNNRIIKIQPILTTLPSIYILCPRQSFNLPRNQLLHIHCLFCWWCQ